MIEFLDWLFNRALPMLAPMLTRSGFVGLLIGVVMWFGWAEKEDATTGR